MKNFQNLTLSDYFGIVRRRIWYVVIATIVIGSGTAVYAWRTPSIYKSETTILVSGRLLPVDYIGSITQDSVADRIELVRQQLRSRTFLERIAQEFPLTGNASTLDEVLSRISESTEITVFPPNSFKLGFLAIDAGLAQQVTRRLADRVVQLNDSFRKEKVQDAGQFLDEVLRQAASDLSRTDEAIRQFYRKHFPGVPEDGVSVEALNELREKLAKAEDNLATAVGERKSLEQRLKETRDLRLAMLAPEPEPEVRSDSQSGISSTVPSPPSRTEQLLINKQAELRAAQGKYTPAHPDVVRLAREVGDLEEQLRKEPVKDEPAPPKDSAPVKRPVNIIQNVVVPTFDAENELRVAEIQRDLDQTNRNIARQEENKKDLSKQFSAYQRRMNLSPETNDELITLTRDNAAAKQRYNYLQGRKLNSDLAGKIDTNENNQTFQVVDPANLPQRPIRPNRPVLVAAGCLAGILFGFGVILLREYVDPTLGDEEGAATALKLPILTSIPDVTSKTAIKRGHKIKEKPILSVVPPQGAQDGTSKKFYLLAADSKLKGVILDPLTVAGEQFRLLRAQLSLMQRNSSVKSVLIASAIPHEGKTFSACCLAGILAQEPGKKVLLIDADLRKGTAAREMGLVEPTVGLRDVLLGDLGIDESLMECADLKLYFLPSGAAVEQPSELLSSTELERIINHVTQLFDWVIVDSPPILPLADANLLVPLCDSTLLVVNAEKTPLNLVQDAVKRIGRDRICGVLMNRARAIRSSYYYSHYYKQLRQSKN